MLSAVIGDIGNSNDKYIHHCLIDISSNVIREVLFMSKIGQNMIAMTCFNDNECNNHSDLIMLIIV